MSASNWCHLEVEEILRETDKAMLVRLEGGEELWIPFSQMSDSDTYEVGDTDCTISVTRWFAEKNGIG